MNKNITTDDLLNANRKGYSLGISLAEIMLIILFIILLFLIRKNNENEEMVEIIEACGALCESENLTKISNSTFIDGILNLQEFDKEWVTLESDPQSIYENLPDVFSQEESPPLPSVKKGDTSICLYDGPKDIGKSYPIATIYLQNERMVILNNDISQLELAYDKYGEIYDTTDSSILFEKIARGTAFTYPEFERLNGSLDNIGDAFETETRANCRFAYNYYFDNSFSVERLDYFNTRYWPNKRISEDAFKELETNIGVNLVEINEMEDHPELLSSISNNDLPITSNINTNNTIENSSSIDQNIIIEENNSLDELPDLIPPQWITKEIPVYPQRAKARNIEGYVKISFIVSDTGVPGSIRIVESTNTIFDRAADEAIRSSRFVPAYIDEKPTISERLETLYSFSLQD
jgi:TonB family protein